MLERNDFDSGGYIIVGGHNPNDKTKLYIVKPKKVILCQHIK